MKAIMLSIQPRHVENICTVVGHENGKPIYKKTVEVRKTAPKCETPFKCYIYETKGLCDTPTFVDEDGHISYRGRGAVIGEFVCDKVENIMVDIDENDHVDYLVTNDFLSNTCLSFNEICRYLRNGDGYGWHISDLKIYDKPKELGEFNQECKQYGAENPLCDDCKYFDCCRGLDYDESDCVVDGLIPLSRPPQSWCYCEELSE